MPFPQAETLGEKATHSIGLRQQACTPSPPGRS